VIFGGDAADPAAIVFSVDGHHIALSFPTIILSPQESEANAGSRGGHDFGQFR
jgi:hypothetical protein